MLLYYQSMLNNFVYSCILGTPIKNLKSRFEQTWYANIKLAWSHHEFHKIENIFSSLKSYQNLVQPF